MTILATDILDQLDQATHDAEFPVFDNGYVSFAAARLSGYRSEEAWGIVIEVLGYYYLERQFEDRLYVFGSCVPHPGIGEFIRTFEAIGEPLLVDKDTVNPMLSGISIRGRPFYFSLDARFFADAGIALRSSTASIHPAELLRAICYYRSPELLGTDKEIESLSGISLPRIIRLSEWEHPDVAADQLPSQSRSIQMLAQALSEGNADLYDPKVTHPNTHWRNWLAGGTL